jgi:hypothetical protein
VRTEATTYKAEARSKGRSALLLALALGVLLASLVAMLVVTQREAQATFPGQNGRIAFASERTTGVDNPTGDSEIFTINPDGTGLKQLTNNSVGDYFPVVSPDGTKIAYESQNGDYDIFLMNASDGSDQKNLTNNYVNDFDPVFSPGGAKIAYWSEGKQTSNPEGDIDVYRMNALDGSSKKNLSNNAAYDEAPDWGRQAM